MSKSNLNKIRSFLPYLSALTLCLGFLTLTSNNFFVVDTSKNQIHSLKSSTINTLKQLPERLEFYIFLDHEADDLFKLKKQIANFFKKLRQYKTNIYFNFYDPDKHWSLVRRFGLNAKQEIVVQYQTRVKKLKTLDEQVLNSTLLQLADNKQRWIAFLEGHGEKSPWHEISYFANLLKSHQANIQTLNLAKTPVIPNNTDLLVIVAAKTTLSNQEVSLILRYINNGGNLLWLHDPGYSKGMSLIAKHLGLSILPGIIIEPSLADKKPAYIVTNKYNLSLTITKSLAGYNSVFPVTSGLKYVGNKQTHAFSAKSVVSSSHSSWSETDLLTHTKKQFNVNSRDTNGPLTIIYSLQRQLSQQAKAQRIIVSGDSDFLSNKYITVGINKLLALNIINWLSHYDAAINIQARSQHDTQLNLSYQQILILSVIFTLLLPGAFVLTAYLIQRKRYKHQAKLTMH